jgi:hypothetical protein
MPKYEVKVKVEYETTVEVEAPNEDDASIEGEKRVETTCPGFLQIADDIELEFLSADVEDVNDA